MIVGVDVRAVVFDWYGTLCSPNPDDFWTRLPELIRDAGGAPDAEAIHTWDHGHPVEHVQHSRDEATYRSWQRSRLAALLARCDLAEPAAVQLLDWIDDVRYTRLFEVFPDVAAVLAALRARGLRLGLCSNWDWDLDRHLDHNGVVDAFDFVVCSATLGYRKPHRTIFDTVVTHAGVPATKVAFVGDSWHDDVAGAAAAGLRPVHIARNGSCARVEEHGDVACVPDLAGVVALLA